MSLDINVGKKPRVVSLGRPEFIDAEYIRVFQKDFDYDVSYKRLFCYLRKDLSVAMLTPA